RIDNPVFRLIYNFFKRKEKEFVRDADHIVCLTESARIEIGSWGVADAPVSVIPTCVDMKLFDPERTAVSTAGMRRSLSISPDDFVLVYLGSWGTWYMTDEVLAFFSTLASRNPKSRLLILTPD